MTLTIASDLHIWGTDDPLYQSLLNLIRERTQPGDTLVLAGDVFDLFVGDKNTFTNRYAEFVSALKEAAARGVQTHYIEGNHDFLLGPVFKNIDNISIHPETVTLTLNDRKFFISHGDLVDTTDTVYRLSRLFFRSPIMKFIVKVIPGSWLDEIGNKSSQYSRGRKPLLPSDLSSPALGALRKKYRDYASDMIQTGFDYVVMGHCHDLDEVIFSDSGRAGQYINVGYPRVHGTILVWRTGDPKITREKF